VLVLWVSSTSEDMDIFATIRNIGPDGKDLFEMGQQGEPLACVTKGWLRASHRKLDPEKSLPYRPYHAHNERWWLKPGEIVECQVEIWATCMVFRKGHRIRLDISPMDGVGTQHFTHFHADYAQGSTYTIHSGGLRFICCCPSFLEGRVTIDDTTPPRAQAPLLNGGNLPSSREGSPSASMR
jgi:predicted acyl esterase